MKIKVVLIMLLSVLCMTTVSAQKSKKNKKIVIEGTVTDINKAPISNAIIMIDGAKTNSVTNAKGETSAAQNKGEEGVNVGYGSVKKKNVVTQVNSIEGNTKKYASYRNIYDMISREVSGVRVNGRSVVIRGSKDLFGDVPALFVVDGVPTDDVSNISPTDVKSIQVLKGSAAAIYGSRAYGGVILIKTKINAK